MTAALDRMRRLVDGLASDECAGRAAGSPGGRVARKLVVDALRDAGTDPGEQDVPKCNGANVLATIPGDTNRYILVAAHYDHLGTIGGQVFRGADDNAAAVAILVEVARALAVAPPRGRGVVIASFDAEEPPHFETGSMGSEHYARNPTAPLQNIDLMICMDLVGHALGADHLPARVRNTMFVLGAERCAAAADCIETTGGEAGLVVRSAGADIIPPLSDYTAFWERRRPFVFLSNGRSSRYHTPQDVPEHLDWNKMLATSRWLERYVRTACDADARFEFVERRDDRTTLDGFIDLVTPLAQLSEQARGGLELARHLRSMVERDGSLPKAQRPALERFVSALEEGLA